MREAGIPALPLSEVTASTGIPSQCSRIACSSAATMAGHRMHATLTSNGLASRVDAKRVESLSGAFQPSSGPPIPPPRGAVARLTTEQVTAIVDELGDMITALRGADPEDKLDVYRNLGLRLTSTHRHKRVRQKSILQRTVGIQVVSEATHGPTPNPVHGYSGS